MITYHHNFTGDWAMKRGSTWDKLITWNNPDGTPTDLTAASARMQVRARMGSKVITEFNSAHDSNDTNIICDIILGGALGTIRLFAHSLITALLPPGDYQYDLEVTIGNETMAILEGDFEIDPNITE